MCAQGAGGLEPPPKGIGHPHPAQTEGGGGVGVQDHNK